MLRRWQFIFTLLIVALALLSCDLPFQLGEQPEPTALAFPTRAPTVQLLPSAIPTAVPTAVPTKPAATATPTKAPVVDLSGANLKLSDLPAGFQELDAASQAQIGLTPETMAAAFQNSFKQAKIASMTAFMNPSANAFEVVICLVFHPLTSLEQAAFDLELADPSKAIASFAQGFGGKAEPIAGADKFGNASIGFTFTNASGALTLRGDMVIARRESAAMLMMVMYKDGAKPPITVQAISPVVDGRVKTALGK